MIPVMIENNEFVVSFDIATGKIKLRNPHGPETDGNYVVLKKVIEGMANLTKPESPEAPQKIKGYTQQEIADQYADYCKERPTERVPYDRFVDEILEEKPMNREELEEYHRQNLKNKVVKGSEFYKDMLEAKEVYDKLHKLGAPEGGFYRAIVWALEKIDKEVARPY